MAGELHILRPVKRISLVVGILLTAALACGEDSSPYPDYGVCGETFKDIPVEINRSMDILFVIDNSPSMAEEHASLLVNFDRFVNVLENIEGGLPNVHIGVISADLGAGPYSVGNCVPGGDGAVLQSSPHGDCEGPTDAYISDVANYDGTRARNYSGDLAETFACIADLGTDGCEFSQPIAAARRALDGSVAANNGFLREEAFLQIVYITDQDDCSAADTALFDPAATELGPLTPFRCFEQGVVCDPDEPRVTGTHTDCQPREGSYFGSLVDEADALRSLTYDPGMVLIAAIVGMAEPVTVGADGDGNPVLEPSCVSPTGSAEPGVRLVDFAKQFPQRNTLAAICNEDLSDALILIAQMSAQIIGIPCIEGAIDLDPDTPGMQYDCIVSDVRYPGTDEQEETLLPMCESVPPEPGTLPCWEIVVGPDYCPDTASGSYVEVYRGGANVPRGTHTIMRCSTGCTPP